MENNSFEYTYSAQQQQEVEAIRKKYIPKEEDKMSQLRKLHESATKKAQALSIIIGTIGALILGTVLGNLAMLIGIPVGLLGLLLVAMAYPVYNRVLKKERERIAPEILRLSEELLK